MKTLKKLSLIFALGVSAVFTSCYDPVFYNISQDVESEDATVSGIIPGIVRYTVKNTEYLVCNADGGIRYKLASNQTHGSWATYNSLPFSLHSYDYYGNGHSGQQILKLAADDTYLYMLSCTYQNDNDEGTSGPDVVYLYAAKIDDWGSSPDGGWKPLTSTTHGDVSGILKTYKDNYYYYSAFNMFCTNTLAKANRKAYLRSGNINALGSNYKTCTYYTLSGGAISDSTVTSIGDSTSFDLGNTFADSSSCQINSVAYFGGAVHPFETVAVTTNETSANATPTYVYWGNGSTLCYAASSDSFATKTSAAGVSRTISSLAVSSDYILVGRGYYSQTTTSSSGGITHVALSSGVPAGSTSSFSTNAENQLSSGYTIYSLLSTTPDLSETSSALYATIGFSGTGSSSSVSYSSIGMWSYYPGRGNWNRE